MLKELDLVLYKAQQINKKLKEIKYEIKKISLKRKDILIIKIDMLLKESDIDRIEQRFKKKLHRKVLVLDKSVSDIKTVGR